MTGGIQGFSEISALLLSIPELEIDEAEAARIAKAILKVQACYPEIDIPARMLAWMSLAGALGSVAGPRIPAYRLRKRNEKAAKVARIA